MRYRPLGTSGLSVSVVGLGCNQIGTRLDAAASTAVVDAALDSGVTLFDTADSYGQGRSEELLGRALAGRRDQVVIATKWGHQGADLGYGPAAGGKGGRHYLARAVEASLRRLGTDHIDLYQLHTPDPVVPIEETLAALAELVTQGKVRYIGHSNFAGWQLARAAHLAENGGYPPFISAQNRYSLLDREVEGELIPACLAYRVGMLPYYPLGMGLLTGKVTKAGGAPAGSRLAGRPAAVTPSRLDRVEALAGWASEHGRSLLEVAVGALAAQPAVGSVIAGATSAEQVRANAAAGQWQPTEAECADIDRLAPSQRPDR